MYMYIHVCSVPLLVYSMLECVVLLLQRCVGLQSHFVFAVQDKPITHTSASYAHKM